MRKALVVLATASLAMGVAACGDDGESAATGSGAASSESARGDLQGKVVYYVGGCKDCVYDDITCGMQTAAEKYGIEIKVQQPDEFAADEQIPLVNAAIASRPDVLAVSATDTKALVTPLKQAAAQGIKVMTVGNTIEDESFLTASIVGDNEEVGRRGATLLAEAIGDKEGTVGYVGYQAGGSAITDARQRGFEEGIKRYPNLRYAGVTVAEGTDNTDGATAANAILSGNEDLVGIVGSFLNASLGVASTLRERGRVGQVSAIQMDSDPKGVEYLEAGVFQAIPSEPWRKEGELALEAAAKALSGEPVEKQQKVAPVVFDAANVDDPAMQQYITNQPC